MDDILEILNMPSWSDIGGLKTQLDGNPAGVPAELGSSSSVPEAASKVSKQELMSPPTLDSNRPRFLTRDRQDAQAGGSVDFHSDDSLLGAQLQHQLLSSTFPMETMQLGGSSSLGVNCNMMANQGSSGLPLLQSMHPGDTNSMLSTPSNFVLPSSSLGLVFDSRPWHQPYLGDVQPLIKTDMFSTSNNATNHLFATRYRDTGVPLGLRVNRDGTRGLFNAYAGAHLGQARQSVQGLQHQSNSSSRGSYRSHSGAQPPPINPIAGAPRPRVRARRGQATDPHSIAERQRRERIAERMKELQLLVPNANKTDKAIMLDEIIEYVKFLQIQMKIFGMSRIGSSGTVPSLLPSEFSNSIASTLSHSNGATSESLVNIERQVARLMDENMDSALQFLQSKGFCLMPISMASAMPTNCVHQPIFSGDKLETSTIVTERPGGSMMLLAGNANGSCTGKLGVAREGVDGTSASAGNETRQRSANSGNEEDQRRR